MNNPASTPETHRHPLTKEIPIPSGIQDVEEILESILLNATNLKRDNTSPYITSARISTLRILLDTYEGYNESLSKLEWEAGKSQK